MKTLDINIEKLSNYYINKAIRELQDHKAWLSANEELLRLKIANEIASDARSGFNKAIFEIFYFMNGKIISEGQRPWVSVITAAQGTNTDVVIAYGEDAFFIEFGTGVSYNGAAGTSPHPNGQKLGMTIGSYGKKNGRKKVWGFDKSGMLVFTRGFKATMPMYNACVTVMARLQSIVEGVFT